MIPYFSWQHIDLGWFTLQVWGLMVAVGVTAAAFVGARAAAGRGLSAKRFHDMAAALVVGGLVGARLDWLIFYRDFPLLSWQTLAVWQGGMSIAGGLVGAVVALLVIRPRLDGFWGYVEAAAFAYPLGEGIGRLGCFAIHDHPGVPSTGWLAVDFPSGPRLDLGLTLALLYMALFALFAWWRRRERGAVTREVVWLPRLMVAWGLIRLVTDFLRAWEPGLGDEVRYAYLTPTQYFSAALIIFGLLWLGRRGPFRPAAKDISYARSQ
jgi:phosphatidylglycerol:prolipoprotein diacylglycerol transferase